MSDKNVNWTFDAYKLENGLWNYLDFPVYYDNSRYQIEIPSGFKGIITVCRQTPDPTSEDDLVVPVLLAPELNLEKTTLNLDEEEVIIPYTCNGNGEVTVAYIGEDDEPIGIRAAIVQDKVVISFDPETSVGTFIYRVSVAETEEYDSAYVDITVIKQNPNGLPV